MVAAGQQEKASRIDLVGADQYLPFKRSAER